MKKKLLGMLLVATMAVTSLVGCGSEGATANNTSGTANSGSGAAEEVTVTYWGWDSNFYAPMMEEYSKLHPEVKFEATAVEWGDMLTKAQQALASNSELPVIVPMDITLVGNWKKMGIMEDLKSFGLDTSKYNQTLINAATTDDGAVIGLFENICPSAIAYKRDLAKQYFGTDDPAEVQKMFTSYEDYIKVGKKIADESNGEVFLFHSGQAVAEWLYFASKVPNFSNNTVNISEKMSEVMGTLIDFRDAGIVDSYAAGTPVANATYTDKNHIMYPTPDWALTYYIEVNDPDGSGNWGMIKAPAGYSHGGTAMGITSASSDAQKKAAYDFITWCISDAQGAATSRDLAGYITPDTTIATPDFCKRADEEFFGGQNISELYYSDIASSMSIASPSPYDNDVVSVRNDVAQQIMNDSSITLDAAVKAAVDGFSALTTDDNVTIK